MFEALMIRHADGATTTRLEQVDPASLPQGDVTVEVAQSSLNYKDALAMTRGAPVVRHFPMIPGIDLAGRVLHSDDPVFRPGDQVLATGWGLGEKHWGGMAGMARLPGRWLLPHPAGLSGRQVMGIGTAGFTAMLCVMALEDGGLTPASGPIIVSGAGGGVGGMAVMLLAQLGYQVVAVTGRAQLQAYLTSLGAAEVLPREALAPTGKPLEKARWAGGIDVVGGEALATMCASITQGGTVAACGLAGGMALPLTVAPFILRNVRLQGIDSVMCPRPRRMTAWARLARDIDPTRLDSMLHDATLAEVPGLAPRLLAGHIRGRTVIHLTNSK
ncbi:MDR family oxidoreductase [Komagataeibacter sucrofermentans]|uniref:Oxidoreductase n=1 Tax=Komagataeibacter sucrofermentans TaxID=1053551 RepID=A0A318QLH2_9PROT|nr:MDR family oxidoreductase [Komagataeibacter sucrofermentans]PYD78112.1 oxidoreductase [Komagataeibacter sucrofermentans]GBQ49071.1 alcohol dehydrogenase [Komagataeibacter sucrofermentans DSM 15973]